ncbi:MAG: membrane dipeptidase [Gammaproteobacteria bacterium]
MRAQFYTILLIHPGLLVHFMLARDRRDKEKDMSVPAVMRMACVAALTGSTVVAQLEPKPEPPLVGFADIHTHQFANLGFGGRLVWGKAFDPAGIGAALPDCDGTPGSTGLPTPVHGPLGVLDLLGNAYRLSERPELSDLGHRVKGHPLYTSWPSWDSFTHQQMYYEWVHRAYQGGLRLMVMLAVSNTIPCRIDLITKGFPVQAATQCNDMDAVDKQIAGAKQLEQFIDSQSGGPGKGWYRIAYSSSEAREIIRSGKLAVVLGIEVSNLFNCTTPDACTEEDIKRELRKYRSLGVRHIFPIHEYDNQFGGAGQFHPVLFLSNFLARGAFPVLRDCGSEGYQFKYSALPSAIASLFNLFAGALGQTVSFPSLLGNAHCNNRGLSSSGESLLRKMMGGKIVIDIDHLSVLGANRALEIATANAYPGIASSHTSFVDVTLKEKRHEWRRTATQLQQIRSLGGVVGLILDQGDTTEVTPYPSGSPNTCGKSSNTFAQAYRFAIDNLGGSGSAAVALASDFNGFAGWPAPRFDNPATPIDEACDGDRKAPQTNPVSYPFTLFLDPTKTLDRHVVGQKAYDINHHGVSQAGLLPDFIEDLRRQSVDVAPLFRSAEAYVRMWEKTEALNLFPPTTQFTLSPPANRNGWNRSDVSVTFKVAEHPDGLAIEGTTFRFTGPTSRGPLTSSGDELTLSNINSAEGTYTWNFFSADRAGNREAERQRVVRIDKTAPVLNLAANGSTFTVDQTITISCTATDTLSGIDTTTLRGAAGLTTCKNTSLRASNFVPGTASITASATDQAGNVTQRTLSFTVTAQQPTLCNVVRSLLPNLLLSEPLCDTLTNVRIARDRGDLAARDSQVQAFVNGIRLHAGTIPADEAEGLIKATRVWSGQE